MDPTALTPEAINAVQGKLQNLFASLDDQQRPVLETLLLHAAAGTGGPASETDRGADDRSIIIVGGRSGQQFLVPLDPSVLVGLNPQPLPPQS
ncbi:MAG: hypothetical protein M3063_13170 [Actinomycetota bacterium]|nr:hypothetical protein [Actinomycetota bacterium]